jgi:hypothetical protein
MLWERTLVFSRRTTDLSRLMLMMMWGELNRNLVGMWIFWSRILWMTWRLRTASAVKILLLGHLVGLHVKSGMQRCLVQSLTGLRLNRRPQGWVHQGSPQLSFQGRMTCLRCKKLRLGLVNGMSVGTSNLEPKLKLGAPALLLVLHRRAAMSGQVPGAGNGYGTIITVRQV